MAGIIMGETHTTMAHALIMVNERLKERGEREIGLTALAKWVARGEIATVDWYGTTLLDMKQLRVKAETIKPRKARAIDTSDSSGDPGD